MAKLPVNPPLILVRLVLVLAIVPVPIWAVLARIWRETRGIPKYIWWDWGDNLWALKEIWRTGEVPAEEEW